MVAFLWGPDPWVSPLHVSCRLGLTDITVLLLSRYAIVSGGESGALCRQSPLEEALKYSRANFTWDNLTAGEVGNSLLQKHAVVL